MKPITHPLAIAYCEAMASGSRTGRAYNEWAAAGRPLYVAPTPLPAPALGMRVWKRWQEGSFLKTEPYDIKTLLPGAPWADLGFAWDNTDLITAHRKGDIVLWERQ